ncbi:paraslipin [Photorhabdus aegyptia]|uniref:Membrane protease subunit, stomatin/prohibitin n=1 Tax=Photorhabdus aegyptia TaxID=2805098 RepID=A0A022PDW5_9GAMM|nr:paraslipin [Photorhabdus aegyptia]EYU13891.1 membrane protease subunit, stomatin/prohibitin [Photorhabdus aegyptia]
MSAKGQLVEIKNIDGITHDNAVLRVNAICFIRIADPQRAAYGVENYVSTVKNLVMTTIRNVVGGMELDETLSNRDQLAVKLHASMDWGLILRIVDI